MSRERGAQRPFRDKRKINEGDASAEKKKREKDSREVLKSQVTKQRAQEQRRTEISAQFQNARKYESQRLGKKE